MVAVRLPKTFFTDVRHIIYMLLRSFSAFIQLRGVFSAHLPAIVRTVIVFIIMHTRTLTKACATIRGSIPHVNSTLKILYPQQVSPMLRDPQCYHEGCGRAQNGS